MSEVLQALELTRVVGDVGMNPVAHALKEKLLSHFDPKVSGRGTVTEDDLTEFAKKVLKEAKEKDTQEYLLIVRGEVCEKLKEAVRKEQNEHTRALAELLLAQCSPRWKELDEEVKAEILGYVYYALYALLAAREYAEKDDPAVTHAALEAADAIEMAYGVALEYEVVG